MSSGSSSGTLSLCYPPAQYSDSVQTILLNLWCGGEAYKVTASHMHACKHVKLIVLASWLTGIQKVNNYLEFNLAHP